MPEEETEWGETGTVRAYRVSKQSELTEKEKIEEIRSYDVGDLLYVLREFEKNPRNFEKETVQELLDRLYDFGIGCI